MRQRTISSVGVVIVGVVPALMGGPIWTAVLTALFLIGAHEYHALARRIEPSVRPFILLVLPGFVLASALGGGTQALLGVLTLAVGLPMSETVFRRDLTGAFAAWALSAAGTVYLAVPLVAATALRQLEGTIEAAWLARLSDRMAFGWDANPRGLAWLLLVIVVTWLGDSGAYLIGRSFGRRPLIPVVSPKKTVEGFIGGLACATLTGAVATIVFGLGFSWILGLVLGFVIGLVAVLGDLAESVLKRQAGVKDSGTLIPGHGGMLDRLDALLFTWTAGWYLASLVDRIVR